MKLLVLIASMVAAACAQIVSEGHCGNVEVVQKFDVESYGGIWNELYRYSTEFQPNGDCVTANYSINSFGNVTVVNRMVAGGFVLTIEGTAGLADPESGEAKLLVNFPTAGNQFNDYWVLSTDYETYSLVYACKNLPNDNKSVSTWILSRTLILSPQTVLLLDPIIEAVPGLSWDNYRLTSHSAESCKA